MFKEEIHTELEISASAERVWEVLTDFSSYPEWNPMIRRASGEARAGERLELYFAPSGRKGTTFRPKLLVVEPSRELRWLGQPGIPRLFESEHFFIIEENRRNEVRLVHDMIFYGLLIPLVRKRLEGPVRQPFEEMNKALKTRAEQVHR